MVTGGRSPLEAARRVEIGPEPGAAGLELWSLSVADPADAPTASRGLLRALLARRLSAPAESLRFTRQPCPVCGTPRGRPALAGGGAGPEFSVARAGGLVLVALADRPVGVDVETLSAPATAREVSELLHPEERRALAQLPNHELVAAFTRLWVRKEAYLKALGSGVAHGLDGEAVHADAPLGWEIIEFPVAPGHAAAVALKRPS